MNVGIIGGGACGVICAIKLKKLNPLCNVTIFEQNDRILKKVLKTGNGKCNIANTIIKQEMYNDFSLISNNQDILVLNELKNLGIVLKETTLGRVYPYSESAKTVVNCLLRNLEKLHVEVKTNYLVQKVEFKKGLYHINNDLSFDSLVVATGSIAQEITNGYSFLNNLGLSITSLKPGLVPIITKEKTQHLQGLRIKCNAYVKEFSFSGEILFKNDGLSGILSLDISRIVKIGDQIVLDLMPEYSYQEIKDLFLNSNEEKEIVLEGIFSKMLATDLLKRSNNLDGLIQNIKLFKFTVLGFKDYKEAQIVCGGVNLNEINSNFEVKKYPNLFLGGEVLDVDGASGGYNLYFAWLSGLVIANNIIKKYL